MEHEVFVPVSADRVREALADPARVARAVPGLQRDTDGEPFVDAPLSGRLKVRVGSHSITYRGRLRVSGRDDGSYAIEGDATESRGSGSVKLALVLALTPSENGTTLTFTGSAGGDGRITELPAEAVSAAGARLLSRFAENLTEPSGEGEGEGEYQGEGEGGGGEESGAPLEPFSEGDFGENGLIGEERPIEERLTGEERRIEQAGLTGEEGLTGEDESADGEDKSADGGADEPPAEAAHARRTMIGRSAEEVDHAPPRGRYAPVPAPETVSPGATLRWAAPAAALALASAIVLGRALRRRH